MPVIPGTQVQVRFYTFSGANPPLYEAAGHGTLNLASVNAGNSNGLCVGLGGINGGFLLELTQQANQQRANLSPGQGCQPGNYDDYQDRHLKLIAKAAGGVASETYANTDPCAFSYVNAKLVSQTAGWYEGAAFVDVFDPARCPHGDTHNCAMLYLAPPYDYNHATVADFLQAIEATAEKIIETVAGYNAVAAQQKLPVIEAVRNTLFSSNEYNKRWRVPADQIAGAILAGLTAGLKKHPAPGLVELQFPVGSGTQSPLFASLQTALVGAAAGLPLMNLDGEDWDSDSDDEEEADGVEMRQADENDLPASKVKVAAPDLPTAMTKVKSATDALDQIIRTNQPVDPNSPYQQAPPARQYESPESELDGDDPDMVTVITPSLSSAQVRGSAAGEAAQACLAEAGKVRDAAREVEAAGEDLKKLATARGKVKTAVDNTLAEAARAQKVANERVGQADADLSKAAAEAARRIARDAKKAGEATTEYSRKLKRRALARKARTRNIAIAGSIVGALFAGSMLMWAFVFGLGRKVVKGGDGRFNPDDLQQDVDDTAKTAEIDLLGGPNVDIELINGGYLLDSKDQRVTTWTGADGDWSVTGTKVTYTVKNKAAQAVARYVLESQASTPTLFTEPKSITLTFWPKEIVFPAQDRTSTVTVPVPAGAALAGMPADLEGTWSNGSGTIVFTPKTGVTLTGATKRAFYANGQQPEMKALVVLLPAAPLTPAGSRLNPQPVEVFDATKESGVEITLLDSNGQAVKSITSQTEVDWSIDGTNKIRFAIKGLPTAKTTVSVSYALTYGGKTSVASTVAVTFEAASVVPNAKNISVVTADRTSPVTIALEGAAQFQGAAPAGWSTAGTSATYTPGTLAAGEFTTSVGYTLTGQSSSVAGKLEITFLPVPQPIAPTGISRTLVTKIDVLAANNATKGQVKLWSGSQPVDSLPDPSGGLWTANGKEIIYTPASIQPATPPAVTVAYVLIGDTTRSALANLSLTFATTPVAYDIPSPPNATRNATIEIRFLDFCVIPDGYVAVSAKDRSFGSVGSPDGDWNVKTDARGVPVITVNGSQAIGNRVTMQYSVFDRNGKESNTATITVSYAMMQRFMPMAADCCLSSVPAPGDSVAVQVLDAGSTFFPAKTDSVKLLGLAAVGGKQSIPNALVAKDGKSMGVPGEGTWLVDLNGAVVFQADPTLPTSVAPTPVAYQFADQNGNVSNAGVVVIDSATAEVDQLTKQLAGLDDTAFWAAYQKHVSRPQPTLSSEEFIAITAVLAGATLVNGAGGRNPVKSTDFAAAYKVWDDNGQSWDDDPATSTQGLVSICAALVNQAMPAQPASAYAARYWRLELMTRMAEQAVPDPS